jgi:3-phosphoshikimate 1-carboxyvinyltransferase
MNALIRSHRFSRLIRVPASKSHTIRRLFIATRANGVSRFPHPLDSLDTRSCVSVCRALGAEITEQRAIDSASPNLADENGEKLVRWVVRGAAGMTGNQNGQSGFFTEETIRCHAGNSGTTLFWALAAAALKNKPAAFDGDEQIRRRSAAPLLEALAGLGVSVNSAPSGCVPITVRGPWKGGRINLPCPTSQYLSAMLLAAPAAPPGVVTEIDVPLLNERPYIEMTLSYLDDQGIPYKASPDFSYFEIPGGNVWMPLSGQTPGDFSSAAFPAAAAVISGGSVSLLGLDPGDTQGDKAFFVFLERMGCLVEWEKLPDEWRLNVSRSGPLIGGEFDLNGTPDLMPVMAAAAAFAQGDTALVNAASARIKETDRVAAMAEGLDRLGVKTTERPDGLVIHGGGTNQEKTRIRGNPITDGFGDHRIVMALSCAALGCPSPLEISGVECVNESYPGFLEMLGAEFI